MSKFPCILAATAAVLASTASAQYDVSVAQMTVIQTIQTGNTTLVAGKATMLRARLNTTGSLPAGQKIDGILRMYVHSVELPNSPVFSVNGPFVPPANPSSTVLGDWLNFNFIAPDSANVTFELEVNPAGPNQVAETNFANNVAVKIKVNFECRDIPEVVYVPIDYRPGGTGGPNLPDLSLIEPGVGDNFIHGIYPVADWEYRPYDLPSKLWTSSLSGSGSSLNNAMKNELQLMNPKPDFIYSWIKGSLPYNGMAQINDVAAMGNTQSFRHQRTFAHELGHNFGLFHNSSNIGTVGVDVEAHLAITEALPQIKTTGKKDIMVGGQQTKDAWVRPSNYDYFLNHNVTQCPADMDFALLSQDPGLYIGGIYDPVGQQLNVTDSYSIPQLRRENSVLLKDADLVYVVTGKAGELVRVGAQAQAVSCADDGTLATWDVPVGFTLPSHINASDVTLIEAFNKQSKLVMSLARSANAPQIEFTAPRPSDLIPAVMNFEWKVSDADGDSVNQYLRYSPDGERLIPIASNIIGTKYRVTMTDLPRLVQGKGYFELIASDGLNTTVTRTASLRPTKVLATLAGAQPETYVLSPDNGKTFQRGTTVFLHCSGWDKDEGAMTGSQIQWISDVDGPVGSGRVTSIDDLSVGTHTLRVFATDSTGAFGRDSAVVTITDRPLPGAAVVCQADLGSGGPGASVLSICGGDLSTGTTATVNLTGAAALAPTWFLLGVANNPTPAFGGTLLPLPQSSVVPVSTDAGGNFSFASFPGGGGPGSFFIQALYLDAGLVQGVGISNALRVDLLP